MPPHRPSRRRVILVLQGSAEFVVADGTARAGVGDVLIAEDMTGEGHVTRLSGNLRTASFTLADDADVPWA
jgi:hypothetical protein